jgi:DNA-binding beta-propeller fold protein YncE
VCCAVALTGCATQEEAWRERPAEIVFPAPPDQPRLVFERTIFSSADLFDGEAAARLRTLVTGERDAGRGFSKPFDVATCKGTIYVSDSVERMVLAFDARNRRAFDVGADGPGAVLQPLGLDTDGQCNLYVADASRQQVLVYQASGRFLRAVGSPEFFHRLSHVAASPDGRRIYAVDTGGIGNDEHRVRVFDAESGAHLRDIGRRGNRPGEFNLPRDVEVGADGEIYVVDSANFRVQVLSADGQPLRTFGSVGRQPGHFSRPMGIALDAEGRVYVSDAAFGNFQVFTAEGQLLMYVGRRGARPRPATYMLPAGIDVDEDGRILMVDQFFRKVDVYRPVGLAREGGFLGAWNGRVD